MAVDRTHTETEATFVFSGSQRVGDAQALQGLFVEELSASSPLVTLDLTGVDAVDVTFFQLALVFQKALVARGRHLIFRTLPPDHVVAETARLLGVPLNRHFTQVEAVR